MSTANEVRYVQEQSSGRMEQLASGLGFITDRTVYPIFYRYAARTVSIPTPGGLTRKRRRHWVRQKRRALLALRIDG